MTVFIGADHRGFELKEKLLPLLTKAHDFVVVVDKGAEKLDNNDDYNDFAKEVAKEVAKDPEARGILICGSAHGVCMQANRFKGVRAINGVNDELVKMGREHNDANVLCLPADFIDETDAERMIHNFLHTKALQGEKYLRRNQKLDEED